MMALSKLGVFSISAPNNRTPDMVEQRLNQYIQQNKSKTQKSQGSWSFYV